MAWIVDQFGPNLLREVEVILPTQQFFPDEYHGATADAEARFQRVCTYTRVERSRVRLRFVAAKHDDRGGPLFIQSQGDGAAGTYQGGDWQVAETICIEQSQLRDPMALVATMAH